MAQPDPILFRELPVIQRIIEDETWLEGERRRCFVSPNDPVVREHVCSVILRIGASLRSEIAAQMSARGESARSGGSCHEAA